MVQVQVRFLRALLTLNLLQIKKHKIMQKPENTDTYVCLDRDEFNYLKKQSKATRHIWNKSDIQVVINGHKYNMSSLHDEKIERLEDNVDFYKKRIKELQNANKKLEEEKEAFFGNDNAAKLYQKELVKTEKEHNLLAEELVHLSKQIGFVGNIDVMVTSDINDEPMYAVKRCRHYLNRDVEMIIHNYMYMRQQEEEQQ